MTRRFELLVFDWDGTLMGSAAAIVASLQAACRDLTLPVPGEEQARYIIATGLRLTSPLTPPGNGESAILYLPRRTSWVRRRRKSLLENGLNHG